jgi:hypothetical protein
MTEAEAVFETLEVHSIFMWFDLPEKIHCTSKALYCIYWHQIYLSRIPLTSSNPFHAVLSLPVLSELSFQSVLFKESYQQYYSLKFLISVLPVVSGL